MVHLIQSRIAAHATIAANDMTIWLAVLLILTPVAILRVRRIDPAWLKLLALSALVLIVWQLRVLDADAMITLRVDRLNARIAAGEARPDEVAGGGAARVFAIYFGWLQAIIWIGLNWLVIALGARTLRWIRR